MENLYGHLRLGVIFKLLKSDIGGSNVYGHLRLGAVFKLLRLVFFAAAANLYEHLRSGASIQAPKIGQQTLLRTGADLRVG